MFSRDGKNLSLEIKNRMGTPRKKNITNCIAYKIIRLLFTSYEYKKTKSLIFLKIKYLRLLVLVDWISVYFVLCMCYSICFETISLTLAVQLWFIIAVVLELTTI